ncbi:AraC family transcriptional regulator [Paenibacillus gansuensis]|uniref:Helix-turn-helix domain-containing protein n=1 Tax=Paenibacillus gansuensis TaxID=306542 RepID=A0ABW5PGU9_9BACL
MSGKNSSYPVPVCTMHRYWIRKETFELAQDRYDSWVVFAVEEGRFLYQIGEEEGTAGFGDVVWCPPGTVFYREVLEPLTFHYCELVWEGEPPRLPVKVTLKDRARLLSTYEYAKIGLTGPEAQTPTAWLQHFLADVWLMAMRETAREEDARVAAAKDPIMQKAAQWLEKHAYDKRLIKELAAELGLSPVQLARRFHQEFGVTPVQYVTSLRIERAGRLLLESDWTLDRIAADCGYENGFYLSRVFTKHKQMSPSAYRRLYRVQV